MTLREFTVRYRLWLGLAAFVIWDFPQWFQSIWGLFRTDAPAPVIATWLHNFSLPSFSAYWITTPIALFVFFFIWWETRRANARKDSALTCSFDASDSHCVRPTTKIFITTPTGTTAIPCTYYRLKVSNRGGEVLKKCIGRLTYIRKDGAKLFSGENLKMPFTPAEDADADKKDIKNGVPETLDAVVLTEDNRVFVPTYKWYRPSSIDLDSLFKMPGRYTFHFVIAADNAAAVEYDLHLDWTGDFRTSSVSSDKK